MRSPALLVLPFLLGSFTACGDQAAAAMSEASRLAGQAAEAAKALPGMAAVATTFADLTKSLGSITDAASAEQVKSSLTTLVDSLQAQIAALGGFDQMKAALGSSDLVKRVVDQVTRLLGNADIAKSVGPVLEQLQGLLGGK